MDSATARTQGGPRRVLAVVAVVVAAALQLVVGFFTSTSGLVAPLWAIVVLGMVWLVGVALLIGVARRQPLAAPLVPLVNGLLLWAAIAAGGAWLGWAA